MPIQLQGTINFCQPFIDYIPASAGVNNEPVITLANNILNVILGAPFSWAFNRAENTSQVLTQGTQDYTVAITDFGWAEKASLTLAGAIFEIPSVLNTSALAVSAQQGRPNSMSVKSINPGTSVSFRFMGVPDAAYTLNLTYQKAPTAITALTGTWSGIPDFYSDIYSNLFLAELYQLDGQETSARIYRQRGVASLLSRAEGLTDAQKNIFMTAALKDGLETAALQLRLQQAVTARSI